MNKNVDEFLFNVKKWKEELTLLRTIVLDCNLVEEYKWMHPCYTYNGKNIVILGDFKDYCSLSFFKGVLLKDEHQILVQSTENEQSGRQLRFSEVESIKKLENTIQQYIYEAIEIEKSGAKVITKTLEEYDVPEELTAYFVENTKFKKAFTSLTKGRQKGYLLHFNQAKQSSTRIKRIKNYEQRILDGYGMRDCTCGFSKRMPNCDGSHKNLK